MGEYEEQAKRMIAAYERLGGAKIHEVDELQDQLTLGIKRLEEMFGGAKELAVLARRHPDHPAVVEYDGLKQLASSPAVVQWPNEFEDLEAHARTLIEASSWAPKPPYDDVFESLDEKTRRWVVPSLRDPKRYEDLMAELYFWGRLRAGRLACELIETESMPDLEIRAGEGGYAEVKRVRVDTQPRRIAEVIKDANRKFKKADPETAGTLLVNVARKPGRARLDDRVPNDITPYVAEARRALHPGQYRSVGEVLICWEDFFVIGRFPGVVLHVFFRRALRVTHPEPRSEPLALNTDSVSLSVVAPAFWPEVDGWESVRPPPTPPRRYADVVVTELFRSTSEFRDGIRSGHAVEAWREFDCAVGSREDDLGEVFLASRQANLLGTQSTLLIFAIRRPNEPAEIQAGFHLLDPPGLWFNAEGALALLIQRFGLRLQIGAQAAKFIRRAVVPRETPVQWEKGDSEMLFALSRRPTPDLVDYRWVFCLDMERYRESLRNAG